MAYNWIYTTSNDNVYILFLIVLILVLIIVNLGLWKRKNDKFFNITSPPAGTTIPSTTTYQAPTATNPAFNMALSEEEKQKYYEGLIKIDGDQETVVGVSDTLPTRQNDILNQDSSLYTWTLTGNASPNVETALMGNYATIDDIGKSITDTLGGIKTNLGYAILDEQIGTFKKIAPVNPYEYDNTADYYTGMNSKSLDGVGSSVGYGLNGYGNSGGTPIFLQKDFTGVANIFAPNIIVANPPLNDDGFPDISFSR
jgi:hypothetical protein